MITGPPPKFHGSWDILLASEVVARTRSITHPSVEWVLRGLAGVLAEVGHHDQAAALAIEAAALVRSVSDPARRVEAFTELAGLLAAGGRHEQAAALASEGADLA
ncbi:MAG TPA: hypothetical protein VLK79_07120, partial [Gaiellales bacterium]|nr:hypothetical protein [Gaiellales bacterium]